MKRLNGFSYFLSAFIATGAFLLFAALPLRLYKSVWKEYRILAVPASAALDPYIAAAERSDISGIVSELSAANRFSFIGAGRSGGIPFTAMERYTRWFRDKTGELRYLYIPYTSLFRFIKLYFFLYTARAAFYLEPAIPYAPLKLCLALILFFYCIAGSRNKALFSAAAIGFLCYAFCVKSSLSLVTALLSILTAAYWLEALENKLAIPWKQLKTRIRRNVFMLILPGISLLTALIDGAFPFLFFLLALLLTANALFSVYSFLRMRERYLERYRQHPSLKLFVMHPQSWSQFWNTRYATVTTILTGCLLLLAATIPFTFSTNRLDRSISNIAVPQPVLRQPAPFTDAGFFAGQDSRPQGYLPDLSSYIEDCWYAAVRPYINIRAPLQPLTPNAHIRFDSFREDSGGKVHREEKILYTFDTAFVMRALQRERLALLPLERMLIAQGGFTAAVHRPLKLFTRGAVPSFFITLGALLFPCILIIMAKIR